MRCTQCGHVNVTAFEFCEECLAILPGVALGERVRASRADFDFAEERALESRAEASRRDDPEDLATFPWNPPEAASGGSLSFVRERELQEALALVDRVVERAEGQLLLMLADLGLGSASLLARLRDAVTKKRPEVRWARAVCRDEPSRPYGVLERLVRDALGAQPSEDDWVVGERLLQDVLRRFASNESRAGEAREVACLIAFLTGLKIEGSPYIATSDEDASSLVPRAGHALLRWLVSLADAHPIVLVLESAQHASSATLSLIDMLADAAVGHRLFVLVAGRPDLVSAIPSWSTRRAITLKPLPRSAAAELVGRLLNGVQHVPPELVDRVVTTSAGNPYAIRAVLRFLHETDVIHRGENGFSVDETALLTAEIPETLRGVAAARLAALSPDERTTLQQAAVIGPSFHFGALLALRRLSADRAVYGAEGVGKDEAIVTLRAQCHTFVEREMLVEIADRSLPGEQSYQFRSERDQELLYDQCPARLRHRYHRVIGHWLELQPQQYVDSHLGAIARHFERGGEDLRAATCHLRAARACAEAHDNGRAIEHYEDALRLLAEDDYSTRVNTLFGVGKLWMTVGRTDRALDRFRAMLKLAWTLRSRSKGAVALNKLGQVLRSMGQYVEAHEHFVKSLHLFRAVNDVRGVASVLDDLGQLAWLRGDAVGALATFEKSRALRMQLKDLRGLALTLHYIGSVHLERAEYATAERYLLDALAIRRKVDDRAGLAGTLNNLAVIRYGRGEATQALDAWQESLKLATEVGNRPMIAMLRQNLGETLLLEAFAGTVGPGALAVAAEHLGEAQAIATTAGDRRMLANVLANLAYLAMQRGEHTTAIRQARLACEHARDIGSKRALGLAEVALGDVTIGTSWLMNEPAGIAEGLAQLERGLNTLDEAGADVERASALEQKADILRKLGRPAEAQAAEAQAHALFATHRTRPPVRRSPHWIDDGRAPPRPGAGEVVAPAAEVPAAEVPAAEAPNPEPNTAPPETPASLPAPPAPAEAAAPRKPSRAAAKKVTPMGDGPAAAPRANRTGKSKRGKR